jgi:thiol:disulfide interchange protein DsbA
MMDAYRVDRWPVIAVGGRWLTSPSHASEHAGEARTEAQQVEAVLPVMDYLVAKAKR